MKPIAPRKTLEVIIEALAVAPSSQLNKDLKSFFKDMRDNIDKYTTAQMYDSIALVNIRTGLDRSPFVQELCNIREYYERPEGDKRC